MIYGYARVSTSEQETTLQLDALRRGGAQQIYQEKTSSVGRRPELRKLLSKLTSQDTLIVYKLDRLARSLKDLLHIVEQLETIGCGFRSMTEPIDTTNPAGRLMLNILGSFAEFERGLIRERALAGQAASWSRGVRWGGTPRVLSDDDARCVYDCYQSGWFTPSCLAEIFQVSVSSIWRVIWRIDKPDAPSVRRGAPTISAYLAEHQDVKKPLSRSRV